MKDLWMKTLWLQNVQIVCWLLYIFFIVENCNVSSHSTIKKSGSESSIASDKCEQMTEYQMTTYLKKNGQ